MPVAVDDIRGLAGAALDLVLPRRCVGCSRLGAALCPKCVPRNPPLRVDIGMGDGLRVVAAAPYAEAVRTALLAYKERGRRDLTGPLADLLRRCLADQPTGVLVPVPSAAAVARARGGDHVLRLTRALARRTGRPVATPLTLARAVADSAGLGSSARAANLAGAMSARSPGPIRSAVIVDDIVTTGATVREAARALEATGWAVAGAVVVAATPRR